MKKMLSRFVNIGVEQDQDYVRRLSVQLSNIFAIVSCVGVLLNFIINIILEKGNIAYLTLAIYSILIISVLSLNYLKKQHFAQLFLTILPPIFVTFFQCIFGKGHFGEFLYLAFVLVSFIFFDFKRATKIALFVIACFVFESIFLKYNEPIFSNEVDDSHQFLYFLITVMIISFLTSSVKKANKEHNCLIAEKNKQLAQQNLELEIFTQIASHDLKSPLRNISSFSGLAKLKISNQEYCEVNEYLGNIEKSSIKMSSLIDDLMIYLKFNNDDSKKVTKQDLNILLGEVLENLRIEMTAKQATVKIGHLPTYICERTSFIILFQNIIQNGLKYNRNIPEIEIECVLIDGFYQIKIKDNGIGIEEQYFSKIFEHFQRLHPEGEFSGTGLGLAICKRIVERHNCGISLISELGIGTTFILHLPIQQKLNKYEGKKAKPALNASFA